jgi:hypothetical protein
VETFVKALETKKLTIEEFIKAFDGRLSDGTILFRDAYPNYNLFAKSQSIHL